MKFQNSSYRTIPLAAFNDNYIWLLRHDHSSAAVVVDPGDAQPVLNYLKREDLKLVAILATHHHADHTGGIGTLCAHAPEARVYGSCEIPAYPSLTLVGQSNRIEIHDVDTPLIAFEVMEVPGHTQHHLAYYDRNHQGNGALFCGDTLFSAGCGRLFEGTPAQMQASLARIRALPDSTQIYCAHEYTERNLEFALKVEPENQEIMNHFHHVRQRRASNQPSLPTQLRLERAINPFLRWDQSAVQQAAARFLGLPLNTFVENRDDVAVFAAIRTWRNES